MELPARHLSHAWFQYKYFLNCAKFWRSFFLHRTKDFSQKYIRACQLCTLGTIYITVCEKTVQILKNCSVN